MLLTALQDVDPELIGWMPAHLTKADILLATATKSNGTLVTEVDRWANDVADLLAKQGVEHHKVPCEDVLRWNAAQTTAKQRARWVGIATYAANNMPSYPFPGLRGVAMESEGGSTCEGGQEEGH